MNFDSVFPPELFLKIMCNRYKIKYLYNRKNSAYLSYSNIVHSNMCVIDYISVSLLSCYYH